MSPSTMRSPSPVCWVQDGALWAPVTAAQSYALWPALGQTEQATPQEVAYAQQLARALSATTGLSEGGYHDYLDPLFEYNTGGLATVITQAAGRGIGELISSTGMDQSSARVISTLVGAIMNQITQIVKAILDLVMDLVKDICDIIPVIGAVVCALIDIIRMIVEAASDDSGEEKQIARERAKMKARRALTDRIQTFRTYQEQNSLPTGVDEKGAIITTPADLFRPIALNIGTHWSRAPFTAPTLCFVYLCGGAADTPLGVTEDEYLLAVDMLRYERGERGSKYAVGMPFAVRRAMWELIKSILAAQIDPASDSPVRMDGGRAIYPTLLDITFRHFRWPERTTPLPAHGYWDEELLRRLVWTHSPVVSVTKSSTVADETASHTASARVVSRLDIVGSMQRGDGFLGQMMRNHLIFLRSEHYRQLAQKAKDSRIASLTKKEMLHAIHEPAMLRKLVGHAQRGVMRVAERKTTWRPLGPASGERSVVAAAAGGGASMLLYSLLGLL